MLANLGQIVSFLGRATAEHAKDLEKLLRDKAWHQKLLDTALREAARGHSRETIIQNHRWAIKNIDEAIKKLK